MRFRVVSVRSHLPHFSAAPSAVPLRHVKPARRLRRRPSHRKHSHVPPRDPRPPTWSAPHQPWPPPPAVRAGDPGRRATRGRPGPGPPPSPTSQPASLRGAASRAEAHRHRPGTAAPWSSALGAASLGCVRSCSWFSGGARPTSMRTVKAGTSLPPRPRKWPAPAPASAPLPRSWPRRSCR